MNLNEEQTNIEVSQIQSSNTLIDRYALMRVLLFWTEKTTMSLTNLHNSTEVMSYLPAQLPSADVSESVKRLTVARKSNLNR